MRINHNIFALNSYRNLKSANASLSSSLEKLSSGKKINKAADDAAGMAISEKMKAQIRGLSQASRNSLDAVSLIQTAEGALSEISEMLQRMKELSVQAANGTLTEEDRKKIQEEINQLTQAIDGIARDTEFNTKKLLSGSTSASGNTFVFGVKRELADIATKGRTVYIQPSPPADTAMARIDFGSSYPTVGDVVCIGGKYYEFVDGNPPMDGCIGVEIETGGVPETLDRLVEAVKNQMPDGIDSIAHPAGANYIELTGSSNSAIGANPKREIKLTFIGVPTAGDTITIEGHKYVFGDATTTVSPPDIKVDISGVKDISGVVDKLAQAIQQNISSYPMLQYASGATINGRYELTLSFREQVGTSVFSSADISNTDFSDSGAGPLSFTVTFTDSSGNSANMNITLDSDYSDLDQVAEAIQSQMSAVAGRCTVQAAGNRLVFSTVSEYDSITINGASALGIADGASDSVDLDFTTPSAFEVTIDGVTKSIAVSGDYATEGIGKLQSDIQNALDNAFGAGRVTVVQLGNKLFFGASDPGSSITIADGYPASALPKLGILSGASTYVEMKGFDVHSTSSSMFASIQIGANSFQSMTLEICNMSTARLGIGRDAYGQPLTDLNSTALAGLSVMTPADANNATKLFDNALNIVTAERAKLGAYQNRLEHTIQNLSVSEENLTSSLSRIEDADMALEIAEYTKNNILVQAGTAMLAQANQIPQMVLQLLK